jgi:hypothetical protein
VVSRSKWCEECWDAELQRKERRHLVRGLEIARAINGGREPLCVAWCDWGATKHQEATDPIFNPVAAGFLFGAVGGLAFVAVNAIAQGGVPTFFTKSIGLVVVTDAELFLVYLGRVSMGCDPHITFEDVRVFAQKEDKDLTEERTSCWPLSTVYPRTHGSTLEFEVEGKVHGVWVPVVPGILHQPSAAEIVRIMLGTRRPDPQNDPNDQTPGAVTQRLAVLLSGASLAGRRVTTVDGALVLYERSDFNSTVIARVSQRTELQLGGSSQIDGREWIEAVTPSGVMGYCLAASIRSHSV